MKNHNFRNKVKIAGITALIAASAIAEPTVRLLKKNIGVTGRLGATGNIVEVFGKQGESVDLKDFTDLTDSNSVYAAKTVELDDLFYSTNSVTGDITTNGYKAVFMPHEADPGAHFYKAFSRED